MVESKESRDRLLTDGCLMATSQSGHFARIVEGRKGGCDDDRGGVGGMEADGDFGGCGIGTRTGTNLL